MTYSVIYDAVIRKTKTTPPNIFIGNVEMAAAIGLILGELQIPFECDKYQTPEELRSAFLEQITEQKINRLSEQGKIMYQLIVQYQVKKMVNETMQHLQDLCERKTEEA